MCQSSETKKRPAGIVPIAVLWTISAVWNIYDGLNAPMTDLKALPYLSSPNINEWFRFGVPAEMIISFFIVAFGFLLVLVVCGLSTARLWSYHFAFACPIIITRLNLALLVSYSFAPLEQVRNATGSVGPFIVGNIVFLAVTGLYLIRPHVK